MGIYGGVNSIPFISVLIPNGNVSLRVRIGGSRRGPCVAVALTCRGCSFGWARIEHPGSVFERSMEEVCSIDMYLHARIKIICPP